MAHFWMAFWTYLRWSLEFLYVPPFLYGTVVLALSLIASAIRQRPFNKPIWKQTYTIVILQFLFFPAVLTVAVVGQVDWQQPHFPGPNYWGLRAEDLFDLGSLILGVYWVRRMKGLRWFALSLAILQLWLLAVASFIASMSLTGTWL
jgi:hypothetical protein